MGGKKPLRRPLWPPTRATASNYYPLGLDGAGGAAKPLLRAPKKPAPLHGRLPAFSGAVDAFERARKCFLEWRYFFSIILSEFLKNRVALHLHFGQMLRLKTYMFLSSKALHHTCARAERFLSRVRKIFQKISPLRRHNCRVPLIYCHERQETEAQLWITARSSSSTSSSAILP